MQTPLIVVAAALLAVAVGLSTRRLGFLTLVHSESMLPTLTPGQRLLTRCPSTSRPVRRGDIVVVRSAELNRLIVKRVVGLPHEHVRVAAGEVRVNGKFLPEPYVTRRGGSTRDFDVPDGHLLLLGDNRARSNDSRNWRQPYLPMTALHGFVLPSRGHSRQRSLQPRTSTCAVPGWTGRRCCSWPTTSASPRTCTTTSSKSGSPPVGAADHGGWAATCGPS
jgi:signal peptidase I